MGKSVDDYFLSLHVLPPRVLGVEPEPWVHSQHSCPSTPSPTSPQFQVHGLTQPVLSLCLLHSSSVGWFPGCRAKQPPGRGRRQGAMSFTPDGLSLRALSSSDLPFPYGTNQQSKHNFGRVKIRPTDLTRLAWAKRVHPHAPSCPSLLLRASANPSTPQAVTVPQADCEPGTPDTRGEAVITRCIIWLLNGLFTKVCMMKSQASQSQDEAGWEEGGNH